jgi:hypothetical protein
MYYEMKPTPEGWYIINARSGALEKISGALINIAVGIVTAAVTAIGSQMLINKYSEIEAKKRAQKEDDFSDPK